MIDLDAYFVRIGYTGPRNASLDVLRALHELHPAAITFEAIDVLLDRDIDLAPAAIDAKLIHARRGGYCYEQNSLLQRALAALGFEVEGLIARVRWLAPPDAPPRPRTHMVLRVRIDGEWWLADVGFGGLVVTAPLRFDTLDAQPTQHESFRLVPLAHGQRLEALLGDTWEPLYEIATDPQTDADYALANWFSSKHSTSHFRQRLMVSRTTPAARYTLLNNRLTIRQPDGRSEQRTLDAAGLRDALATEFQLPVSAEWNTVITDAVARGNATP